MFKKLRNWFLKIFGDIKVFPYPLWLVYDPDQYFIDGAKLREILDTVQPGDILFLQRSFAHIYSMVTIVLLQGHR